MRGETRFRDPMTALALAVPLFAPAAAQEPGAESAPAAAQEAVVEPERYLRLIEEEGGEHLRLEVCVRAFAPGVEAPRGVDSPRILLVGAIHIADPGFYRNLQLVLDAQDVVLFEQVRSAEDRDWIPAGLTPVQAARAAATARRLRRVAVALERHRKDAGAYPEELAVLAQQGLEPSNLHDTWSRPFVYAPPGEGAPAAGGFRLLSLGADGAPGGAGIAADLDFAAQPPIEARELGDQAGLQTQLAEALGLVFQLDAMNYGGAHWRNSDLTIEELTARLAESDVDASQLFGMLDGSSGLARLAGGLLKLVTATDQGVGMLRLFGIELLARADELLAAQRGELGRMLEILIEDRNTHVLGDLERIARDEPEVRSIGVFYGGGHLREMEQRLISQLGYHPDGDVWLDAVTVIVAETGLSPERAASMRKLVSRTLDRQLGR